MFLRIILILGITFFSSDLLAKDVGGKTVPISGVFSGYLIGFNDDADVIAARCNPPEGTIRVGRHLICGIGYDVTLR